MATAHSANRMHEPHEPHGVTVPLPHHRIPHYVIFGALVVLTVVTVLAYYVLLQLNVRSELVRVVIALFIASIKASLVCLFFMHMKFEGKLIYMIFIIPLVMCVILVCALIPDIQNGTVFNPSPGHSPEMAEHGDQPSYPGTSKNLN